MQVWDEGPFGLRPPGQQPLDFGQPASSRAPRSSRVRPLPSTTLQPASLPLTHLPARNMSAQTAANAAAAAAARPLIGHVDTTRSVSPSLLPCGVERVCKQLKARCPRDLPTDRLTALPLSLSLSLSLPLARSLAYRGSHHRLHMTKAFNAVESVEQVPFSPRLLELLRKKRLTPHCMSATPTAALHLGRGDVPQPSLPRDQEGVRRCCSVTGPSHPLTTPIPPPGPASAAFLSSSTAGIKPKVTSASPKASTPRTPRSTRPGREGSPSLTWPVGAGRRQSALRSGIGLEGEGRRLPPGRKRSRRLLLLLQLLGRRPR
jgi:hypothetical protein